MRINLYPHNATAYEKAKQMIEQTGKAAIIHPTGTGKSYVAFAFAEENPKAHVLWLAPNEYIFEVQSKILYEKQRLRYPNITLMTYPWLLMHRDTIEEMKPDIIVLDEFHRAGAKNWKKGVAALIDHYPDAKVLGLSATNIRYLDRQRDMADELFDGYIASRISLCEAMAREILPTPRYVIGVYRYEDRIATYQNRIDTMANKEKKKVSQSHLNKLRHMLDQACGLSILFEKYIPNRNVRLILFCVNITHAFEMISKAPEWFGEIDFNPHIYCVNSDNAESEQELHRFMEDDSDHLKLLYCVDMLNEGIHVSDIDGVVLLRPTRSPALYKQQIGRALSAGSSIVPTIFDLVNNFDSLYFIEEMKEEWEEQRTAYLRQNPGEQEEIRFEIIDELKQCRELIRHIERSLATPWEIYYEAYAGYVEEHGTVKVKKCYVTKDGLLLGRWMQRQRSDHRLGRMDQSKEDRLDLLGEDWKKEKEDRFEYWYEMLCEYYQENGHSIVPQKYVTKVGERLGSWVIRQRTSYNKGELSEERKKKLEELDFCWDVKMAWWEDGYRHAKAYYDEYQNLDLCRSYISEDGYKLGKWLEAQRKVYQGKVRGNLTPKKIDRLNEIGMIWDKTKPDDMERGIEAYKKFVKIFKTTIVPVKYRDGDFNLRQWVERNRIAYRSGRMEPALIRKLEDAGFVWEVQIKTWDDRYQEAKDFYDENGSLVMTGKQAMGKGECLRTWIRMQNNEYLKEGHGSLTDEQVKKLEAIDITIRTVTEAGWKRGYDCLTEYHKQNGNALVPYDYHTEDGFDLGSWVLRQREKYKTGKLKEEEIRSLEALGIQWGDLNHYKANLFWNEMYQVAEEYYGKNGHLRVPTGFVTEDGHKLGQWINQQRRIRKGELKHSIEYTAERLAKMEQIGMVWEVKNTN